MRWSLCRLCEVKFLEITATCGMKIRYVASTNLMAGESNIEAIQYFVSQGSATERHIMWIRLGQLGT